MSVGLWCAGVEHRDDDQRLRWSCGLVLMDRERWRASVVSWLTDRNSRVTNRGSWHVGHTLAWGRGGVDRVVDVVEDSWNTRLVVDDTHAVRYSRGFDGMGLKTTQYYRWQVLLSLGLKTLWRHVASQQRVHQGEATSCGAHGRWIKNPGVGPFLPPVEWIGSM
jgi:hypothetical protein